MRQAIRRLPLSLDASHGDLAAESGQGYHAEEDPGTYWAQHPIPGFVCQATFGSPLPAADLDCILVHKTRPEDVLVAPVASLGHVLYFRLLPTAPESLPTPATPFLNTGLLVEALRQASIATLHLAGLPLQRRLMLFEVQSRQHRLVHALVPTFIRTEATAGTPGSPARVAFQLLQGARPCLSGKALVQSFPDQEAYERHAGVELT